jgi:2-polyprenyl-6-methoxyphenol hydroxylase-like FAD-dependent oxidoreductase
MAAPLRILIVGGGIAGLGLGRALRQQGFVPELVERAASWPAGGTGLYLPGNGVRALGALGLADKVLARAVCMPHQRILDHTGRLLADIDVAKLWNRVGLCVGIARGELHRILLEGAADVPMRLGCTLSTLNQEEHDVTLAFADGSIAKYDLVVGADGIHSSIRRLVFGDIRPRHLGQVCWRFLVDRSGGIETWTAMLGRRRTFLAMPVWPNRLYCYADLVSIATEDPTGRDRTRLKTLFEEFAEPVPGILSRIENFDSIHFAHIEEIVVDTWVRGRVVLIGDAAHATSPNMAEGASMALEDALVLTHTLATHASPAEALLGFSERRRPRLRWLRRRTHRRNRIRGLPLPLRNLAIGFLGAALYRRDYRPFFEEP